jgi:hypothetical protein
MCSKNKSFNGNISYNDFLNQLFFKVNFTGFKNHFTSSANNNCNSSKIGDVNSPFPGQLADVYSSYALRFNFKNNAEFIYENIFSLCLEMGMGSLNELYDYPFSILFPILEAVHWSRENPCLSWPAYAFDLIGRNDLAILKSNSDAIAADAAASAASQQTFDQSNVNNSEHQSDQTLQQSFSSQQQMTDFKAPITFGSSMWSRKYSRNSRRNNSELENDLALHSIQNMKKEDEDGMQHIDELKTIKFRFNEDLRVKEIRACLQTTRPIQISLTQGPDVSDHDFVEEEEKFLSFICLRTMSLPVGRGIFTLHTINPIPTEPVRIPELNLKGKSLTKKTTIDLLRVELPTNMTYWSLFHNGVASGLTIHAKAKDLSNAWIKAHLARNFDLTNEQAGFLYGLGLTGHLSNFSMLNVHDALARRHDLTNIAILLGLAASKIQSMDLNVTRLISMHIKALMPPVEIELEIPYNIQIAALLSLGLVYVKSANKHISYVLLKEIGRLPGNEIDKDVHSLDREAYSLTAGLALGMILLEKGKKSLNIMDSTFTDELYHYMVGGHKDKYANDSNSVGSMNTGASSNNGSSNGTSSNSNSGTNGDLTFKIYYY